jgi:hypothetical protein
MLALIAFGPSVLVIAVAVVLIIVLRKKKDPAKIAVIFSVIALICGIIHLICQFYPFEYTGGKGIDYIGQAIVWALFVNSIMYATLAAYVSFAVVATVFAVKALKTKETRKKGVFSLILSWVLGLVFASLIITNIASDKAHKKNIKVDVKEVSMVTDTESDPAVMIMFDIYNGTKSDIMYQTAVYTEVSQNGKEIYHTTVDGWKEYEDADIKYVKPGSSAVIRKTYKLKDTSAPVRIVCRTYGGDYTYVDGEFVPK